MVPVWVAGLQVVDWSEGGRTEVAHVKRIFSREHPSGPHQVSALMRRSASSFTKRAHQSVPSVNGLLPIWHSVRDNVLPEALCRNEGLIPAWCGLVSCVIGIM